MLRVILLVLLFVAVAAPTFCYEEPFHLINTGTGAAALGMGGAFVAVADDLSSLYWNIRQDSAS